jgi:hypothetical protein
MKMYVQYLYGGISLHMESRCRTTYKNVLKPIYIHTYIHLAAFFLGLEMFQKKKLERKSKHNFMFSNSIFFRKSFRF